MIDNENDISIGGILTLAKSMALKYGVVGIEDIRLNALANGIEFMLVTGDVVNVPFTSAEMPFDGTISGLAVDNVQDALDYILATLKKNILYFSQTASKTNVCNGTAQELIGTGVGTLTIPANTLEVGDDLYLKFSGILSLASGASTTLAINLNGTTLFTQTASINKTLNNVNYDAFGDIVVRTVGTTGTVQMNGTRNIFDAIDFATATTLSIRGNATINTTIDNVLSVTYTAPTGASITSEIVLFRKTGIKSIF